jgi:hypothetical protein
MRFLPVLPVFLFVAACGLGPGDVEILGPDSLTRAPQLSATVYQRPGGVGTGDSVVVRLVFAGLPVTDVWVPESYSPCMIPNGSENTIVQLSAADDRMFEHGFDTSARGFVLNCGVRLLHYTVRRD